MPSYVVTGASRGIGLEFIRQLSSDSKNIVIGLVRNKMEAQKNFGQGLPDNATFLEADITDLDALKSAATETARLTGAGLDYLINNAALISRISQYRTLGDFADDPKTLATDLQTSFDTNVIGVINTVNAFISLLRAGHEKKVITLSSGLADTDLTNEFEIAAGPAYSISKAALNFLIAKYHATYKKEGILFMAVSPGLVDTGNMAPGKSAFDDDPQVAKTFQETVGKFKAYAPHFTGPISAQESVECMLKLMKSSSVENGNGGSFVSHHGTKQWL